MHFMCGLLQSFRSFSSEGPNLPVCLRNIEGLQFPHEGGLENGMPWQTIMNPFQMRSSASQSVKSSRQSFSFAFGSDQVFDLLANGESVVPRGLSSKRVQLLACLPRHPTHRTSFCLFFDTLSSKVLMTRAYIITHPLCILATSPHP